MAETPLGGRVGRDAKSGRLAVVERAHLGPFVEDEVFVVGDGAGVGLNRGFGAGGETGGEASVALAFFDGAFQGDGKGEGFQGQLDVELAGLALGGVGGEADSLFDEFLVVGVPGVFGGKGGVAGGELFTAVLDAFVRPEVVLALGRADDGRPVGWWWSLGNRRAGDARRQRRMCSRCGWGRCF